MDEYMNMAYSLRCTMLVLVEELPWFYGWLPTSKSGWGEIEMMSCWDRCESWKWDGGGEGDPKNGAFSEITRVWQFLHHINLSYFHLSIVRGPSTQRPTSSTHLPTIPHWTCTMAMAKNTTPSYIIYCKHWYRKYTSSARLSPPIRSIFLAHSGWHIKTLYWYCSPNKIHTSLTLYIPNN